MLGSVAEHARSRLFVGREAELAQLRRALARAERGSPATVVIGGEPGVGKSRLLAEFTDRHAAGATVLTGGCVEHGGDGLPFAPFTAALRALVRRIGADGVIGLLPRGEPGELARLLPDLGRPAAGDDELARTRLFEQLLTLLAALGAQAPVVLAVEDAHWADRSSRELIDFLVRNQQAVSTSMILLSHRSDELYPTHPLRGPLAELARVGWVERLELARLPRRDVIDQIRGLLGADPAPELAELVYRRSEGNPLFVEVLLDAGAVPGELPASMADLLLARNRRLPATAQALVSLVAVGGDRVRHRLLAVVAGLDETALAAALRPAVDGNVLVTDQDSYGFRHALIREAVQADLLPGERVSLHMRYGAALSADRTLVARASTELARHWRASGDPGRALPEAWRAAGEAVDALAYAEQLEMLTLVLQLFDQVDDAAQRIGADRIAVLEQAVAAADRAGDDERGEQLATAALAGIDRERERVRAALLLGHRARMRRFLGRDDDLRDLHEAVRIAPAEHPARAAVLTSLAIRLSEIPLLDEAQQAAEDALTIARAAGDDHAEASALIMLGTLEARHSGLEVGLPKLAEAMTIAERIGADGIRLRALERFANLLEAFGDCEGAVDKARHGIEAAAEVGLARAFGGPRAVTLVSALTALGRWDEAGEAIERALELVPPPAFAAHLRCQRAWIALHRGDMASATDALAYAREALADGAGFAQDPVLLDRLVAEIALAQGRPDDALAAIDKALDGVDAPAMSRFTWPLLVIAARAAWGAAAPIEPWRDRAVVLPVVGPVQRAHSLSFAAECAPADGTAAEAAVRAWDELGQPLPLAQALLGAAAAAVASGGDRAAATVALRRAAELAGRLDARLLRERIDRLARRARIVLQPGVARPDHGRFGITERELEVLRLVAAGRGNREIAQELFISTKTASVHVSHLLAKLGVTNRVEAAAAAHRLGLLND